MSDVVVPLTSPVHLTNIEDIHAVDLHVKYCELVKAYEQLVLSAYHVRSCLCVALPGSAKLFTRILLLILPPNLRCEIGTRTGDPMNRRSPLCARSWQKRRSPNLASPPPLSVA